MMIMSMMTVSVTTRLCKSVGDIDVVGGGGIFNTVWSVYSVSPLSTAALNVQTLMNWFIFVYILLLSFDL